MKHTITVKTGEDTRRITAKNGVLLYDAFTDGGIALNAPCSGHHTCGKCKIRINKSIDYTAEELKLLSLEDRTKGIHLACSVIVKDDLTVVLDDQAAAILSDTTQAEFNEPTVKQIKIAIAAPDLETQKSDKERVDDALGLDSLIALDMLRKLPYHARSAEYAVLYDKQLLSLGAKSGAYGIAVDIGTTTVAAYLYDLIGGGCVDIYTMLNAQRSFGADVITRTEYAAKGETELKNISNVLIQSLNEMLEAFSEKCDLSQLYHIVFAGNTIMMHLLLGINPAFIANAPFIPAVTQRLTMRAPQLGLKAENAVVDVLPMVAGYIGADTVAAVMASDMDKSEALSLLVDIGTNGEMVLGNKDGMICCSAAAGPAFEGAHIQCGMGGVTGAINKVNDDLTYTVIGKTAPVGICGSGLLDAVCAFLKGDYVSESGKILNKDKVLTLSENVFINQKDIREIQLAKAAICAGIELMIAKTGKRVEDIAKLYLAGGFGNYMRAESACCIGLFPAVLLDKIVPIGNAAGTGAIKALLSRDALTGAKAVSEKMKYLELSAVKEFQDLFADNMMLTER